MNKTKISFVALLLFRYIYFPVKDYHEYQYPKDVDECIKMLKAPQDDKVDFRVYLVGHSLPIACSVYSLMKMGPSVVPRLINEYNNMDKYKEGLNPFQSNILIALTLIGDKPSFDFFASVIESKVYCSDAIHNLVYLVILEKPIPKNVLSVLVEKTTDKNEDVLLKAASMLVSSVDMPEGFVGTNYVVKGHEIQKWYAENKDKLYWDDKDHRYKVK